MKSEISSSGKRAKFTLSGSLLASIFFTFIYCQLGFAADASTFAGGEFDGRGQGFSYLGVDVTQKIYQNISLSGRVIPNYLTYRFYSGGQLVRANSPGLYAVGGIKLSWDKTKLGVFGGTDYRHTELAPDIKNAKVRGETLAGVVQGEFDSWLPSRTNVNIYSSFSGTDNFFYERGRIKQQITNLDFKRPYTISAGAEQFIGRNPDFHQEGAGLMLEWYHICQKVSIAVRSGFKHDSTFGNGIYGGLELYKGF
jgi:hypothetical protein